MLNKARYILPLILVAGLILTACAQATPAATAVPAKVFRVAVLMPSARNDMSFSQSMYDALAAVQTEMGKDKFDFVYSENMFQVSDAAAAIRDYATKGFDLVIAQDRKSVV